MIAARVAGVPSPVSFMASESSFSSSVLPAVSMAVSRVPSVNRLGGRVRLLTGLTSTTVSGCPTSRPAGNAGSADSSPGRGARFRSKTFQPSC